MIVITSLAFDIEGPIVIDESEDDTNFGDTSRRQNRIATLDGGSTLQDRGYSNSDLTFSIVAKSYNQDKFSRLRDFIENFPEVRLDCRIGSFIGSLKNLDDKNADFTFLVVRDG